ncbi:MAG: hypothetical protein GF331_02360 [Chitinivibrionales bacterium]|nr:hypothetical protein [Chitinivibrionales bacterium]
MARLLHSACRTLFFRTDQSITSMSGAAIRGRIQPISSRRSAAMHTVPRTIRLAQDSTARVEAFEQLDAVAEQTAELIRNGVIGLSGGSTYRSLFPLWAARRPDCSAARFFPVDERLVPFDDPASNWHMAYELLLQPLGREADKAHFPASAAMYTELLQRELGANPRFDTVFLGAGRDGHTASLFPGGAYLADDDSIALETQSPQPPVRRVTLGPGVLGHARRLIAVVSGAGKQDVATGLLRADTALPLVSVLARHPSPLVYLDAALIQNP